MYARIPAAIALTAIGASCGAQADYSYRHIHVVVNTTSGAPGRDVGIAALKCYTGAMEARWPGTMGALRDTWVIMRDDTFACGVVSVAVGCYHPYHIEVTYRHDLQRSALVHELGHAAHGVAYGHTGGGHRERGFWSEIEHIRRQCHGG